MKREVELGTLFLGNGKNIVIANKVLRYFQCLSCKIEVYAACFWPK